MSLLRFIEEPPNRTTKYPAWCLVGGDRFKDPDSGEWLTVYEFRRTDATMELHVKGRGTITVPRKQLLEVAQR